MFRLKLRRLAEIMSGFDFCDNSVSLSLTRISLQADHVSMADNGSQLTDRSQVVRDRLHSKKVLLIVKCNVSEVLLA